MIKIICLGKIKEKYLEDLVNDYSKRITKYHKIEIIELKDENDLSKEAKNIVKYIDSKDYVISLDINGKSFKSEDFAYFLNQTFINYSNIVFIIGSSFGLDESIKKRSNLLLSFSSMTFPHGLFRGILLEQIYRAFKINNNESYHK
ncbi:MAG: 23S rRNA (pseudouridine(1915)-N(3))-methyltransferase RlmH [bacterium]|nr:23S rRNA (pseudouridine(1915)-N(3))-methyltransferase RlmH [bacterium]